MGTVLISLLLLAIVAAIIRYMVKLKRRESPPAVSDAAVTAVTATTAESIIPPEILTNPPAKGWGVLSLPAPRKKRPTKVGRSPINAFCLTLCLTQQ